MMFQTSTSIAANSVNDNVIVGNQYEFFPARAILDLACVAAATGLEVDVLIGQRAIVTRMIPSTANRTPIVPDDFTVKGAGMPGERLIIRVRNTTGGAVVINTLGKYSPR